MERTTPTLFFRIVYDTYSYKGAYGMRVSHWILVAFASAIWLGIGLFLLNLGVNFVIESTEMAYSGGHPLILWLGHLLGRPENGAIALFVVAILLGLFKGRTVLKSAADRIVERILTLPNPASPLLVYGRRTYILILSMMALGMVLRLFGVPEEIRGTVLVAVGTGLLHGGVTILRSAVGLRQTAT